MAYATVRLALVDTVAAITCPGNVSAAVGRILATLEKEVLELSAPETGSKIRKLVVVTTRTRPDF